jgi:hypothetical protein
MAGHPVRRSLQRDVLPYIVTARRLRKQWFYRLHSIFGYTTDFIVALTAIGVSTPLLTLIGSVSSAGNKEAAQSPPLRDVLSSVPQWLYFPLVFIIITWIVLRVTFNREEGQKRAVLAKSCAQVLRQSEASLHAVLSKSDPMPGITELLEKKIRPTVDRNIQENAWRWVPFAPGIDDEVGKDLEALCSRYEMDWAPIGALGFRQPPSGGD